MSFNFSLFPPGGARAPRDPDSPPVELKMHKPGPGAITLGVLIAIGAIIYAASIVCATQSARMWLEYSGISTWTRTPLRAAAIR